MAERIVPMIHVSDVNATAQWYASIGFEIRNFNRECEDGDIDWALLRLGQSEIMLSLGGRPSAGSGVNSTFTPTSTTWMHCEAV